MEPLVLVDPDVDGVHDSVDVVDTVRHVLPVRDIGGDAERDCVPVTEHVLDGRAETVVVGSGLTETVRIESSDGLDAPDDVGVGSRDTVGVGAVDNTFVAAADSVEVLVANAV